MVIACDIDVKHMKAVSFAEIVRQVHEAGRSCFWYTIIDHDEILVKVESVFRRLCVEQRQKVVWKR